MPYYRLDPEHYVPRFLSSFFEGRDEYWAVLEVRDGRIFMWEATPDYRRGIRWCGKCQQAYPAQTCPICGNLLRAKPKRSKR